jgi:hypothetical protein
MNQNPKYPFEYPPYGKDFVVTIFGEEHKARLMPHRYGYIELLDVGPDDRRIYPIGTITSWHE